jgi:hypothetical protein
MLLYLVQYSGVVPANSVQRLPYNLELPLNATIELAARDLALLSRTIFHIEPSAFQQTAVHRFLDGLIDLRQPQGRTAMDNANFG